MTRAVETIDQELRLLAAVRATAVEMSGSAGTAEFVDQLLDERLTMAGQAAARLPRAPLPRTTDC